MTESPDSGHDIPSAGPSGVAGGVAALLVRQAGVISRAQAIACGMSGRTVARRASTGAWCMVHPGVYLVAGHRPGHESRVRAAALRAGPRATLSGPRSRVLAPDARRAARHDRVHGPAHDAPGLRPRVPVPGVTLRRRVLDPADRTVLHGVAVTTPTCTVREAAPVAGPRFLDRALQRHVGFAELHACAVSVRSWPPQRDRPRTGSGDRRPGRGPCHGRHRALPERRSCCGAQSSLTWVPGFAVTGS
ncbi:type IV toxin-antitoxin system AbiEi family antitoxin domain-containing protein [Pseudonocardia sp. McavD-2-B]|uniref:type IV toxin-antitoxin system AbiEi family antitoxin domain-containing protein n=1 Tax=Pseudonocardia sp. McavD-2-B TaxID=2954499 RepID=UPI0035AB8D47